MLIVKGLARALAAFACLALTSCDKFWEQNGKSCNSETLVRYTGVSNIARCKQKCLDYEGLCMALDYNSDDEMCYLKYECDNPVSKSKNVAAVRDLQKNLQISDFGCEDETLKNLTDMKSITDCKDECDDDPDCRAVTRNRESNKCYLKASCDDGKSESDNESALKLSDEYWAWDDYGCDDPNANVQELEAESMDACKWACDQEVQCRAATFSSASGTCYMSETCEQVKERDANDIVVKRHSYLVLEKTGCETTTLRRSVQTESTFVECMYACDAYASCNSFTFNTDENQCYLKYDTCDSDDRKDKNNNKSAIKKGRKGCYEQFTRVCAAR